jgi:hypothetical protein|tara:strand:- start:360 stop:560 length:201 start_codon:yes stop_codon:yes gene_type:complete
MIDLKETQKELDNSRDFVQSAEYCIVQPGLTHFNIDEIITHEELLIFLSKDVNTLECIEVLPHFSM